MGLFGGFDWHRPKMVGIKAGSFMMGSRDDEFDARQEEKPAHEVTIRKAFEIGKYPVTFAEWDGALKAGFDRRNLDDEGFGRKKRPVIDVRWDDAQAYIAFLNECTGNIYRLPSEAEWEYCCRAGKQTRYLWGDEPPPRRHGYANYLNNETVPVTSDFYKHPWGVMSLPGNVLEWCEDHWHGDYNHMGRPDDGSPWLEGNERGRRVLRAGSWGSGDWSLRSANRSGSHRDDLFVRGGSFRLARTL